jgi:hypothetical protein
VKRLPFANWQPDKQGLTNEGTQDIKNVYPTGGGYAPFKGLSALSTTGLNAAALGAIAAIDSTGTTKSFAGDSSKLYLLSMAAFGDVSKGGGYTVGGTERWEFCQFGQRVIATQIGDVPQYYDLGSSSVFADLAGSPPQARHIAVVRDFVVLANTVNSPNEVAWSGFNNSGQWSAGTNQSDKQTLQGGGWVQAVVGGASGRIYQEHAITRMSYVGPPLYFQFDTIEEKRGLAAPSAIVTVGSVDYFWSQDGFYSYDPSNGCTAIGNEKVDNWFNTHLLSNTFSQITAGVDPVNKLVLFSFVSTDATDTSHPDTVLIYQWTKQEWSYAKIDHEMIYSALSEGWTLEQIGAAYPSIETVPVSFDSRVWTGGAAYLGAFTTGHQLGSFTGSNLAALLETADFEGIPGRRSILTTVVPFCDTANATAVIRSRERFADAVTDTGASAMQSNGEIPVLSSGRYHRVQISMPAADTWTYATGVDPQFEDDGEI